jgi:hypothetical protein
VIRVVIKIEMTEMRDTDRQAGRQAGRHRGSADQLQAINKSKPPVFF